MTNTPEAEVRTVTGDELNRLVHLNCKGDDLSCFEPDDSERVERIVDAITDSREKLFNIVGTGIFNWNGTRWHAIEVCVADGLLSVWNNRHGKPYESDLEAHVQNWRAESRDYAGDMNLAMTLWRHEFRLVKQGDTLGEFWEVEDWKECVGIATDVDTPAVAICRAAVILGIRENANAS